MHHFMMTLKISACPKLAILYLLYQHAWENLSIWKGLMCVFFLIDFCLRIAEDFETSLDDWKPNPGDLPVMNACVVPAGTYEVCSRTINKQSAG